jgi:hypothetical protein
MGTDWGQILELNGKESALYRQIGAWGGNRTRTGARPEGF